MAWFVNFRAGCGNGLPSAEYSFTTLTCSYSTSPSPRSTTAPLPSLQTLLREGHSHGRTIILSTHQLREALELATHVALIQRGQLIFEGPRTQEMADDPTYLYRTYGEK